MKKRLTAIILMLAFFTTSALAATSYKKSIEVEYGISLSINDKIPTLTDVNGNIVQPFTYNGTTYVPIRAVGENLGAFVSYESSTKTAILRTSDNSDLSKYLYCMSVMDNTFGIILSNATSLTYVPLSSYADTATTEMYNTIKELHQQNTDLLNSMIPLESSYFVSAINSNTLLTQAVTAYTYLVAYCYEYEQSQSSSKLNQILDAYEEITNLHTSFSKSLYEAQNYLQ